MHRDVKRAILATRVLPGQPGSGLASGARAAGPPGRLPARPTRGVLCRLAACALLALGHPAGADPEPAAGASFLDLQVSTDGRHVAALTEQGERRHLVIVRRSDGAQQRVTESFGRRVGHFFWVSGERLVFTSPDDTGVYAVDRDGSGFTTLAEPGAAATTPRLVDPLARDAEHILIALPVGPARDAAFRLDVRTGQREPLALPFRDARDWFVDRFGNVRAVVLGAAPAARVFYRADAAAPWLELGAASPAPPGFTLLGLTGDARLVVATPTEQGLHTVQLLDPVRGEAQALAAEPPADARPILKRTPLQHTLVALEYPDAMPRQTVVASFWRGLLTTVDDALPNSRNLLYQMSDDERVILVLACTDPADCAFYLLDRATDRLEFLGRRAVPTQTLPAAHTTQARADPARASSH